MSKDPACDDLDHCNMYAIYFRMRDEGKILLLWGEVQHPVLLALIAASVTRPRIVGLLNFLLPLRPLRLA